MADVLLLAITAGFFGLVVLLVRACDVLIGPDPRDLRPGGDPPDATPAEPVPAATPAEVSR